MVTYHEPELTDSVKLCNDNGRLNRDAVGWSRHPIHHCNLKWFWPRPKRWNYWCITGPEFLLSLSISDRGYVALGSAYFLEYKSQRFIGQTGEKILGIGVQMPEFVRTDIRYSHTNIDLAFLDLSQTQTVLRANTNDFGGQAMKAEIFIERPVEHETLNVVIPWSDEKFQFTSKQECLPAEGTFTIGDETFEFSKDNSYATLDYGRGFWPRESAWNWAAASGIQQGHVVGLNLGGKWTDNTGMNENGFVVDGRLTKIHEDLIWEYDPTDFLKKWAIYAPVSDQVHLDFYPIFNRPATTSWPLIYSRTVNQAFGHFQGHIVTESNQRIDIVDFFGWAEELHARW